MKPYLCASTALLLAASASSQRDDMRDLVIMKNGKEVRGRVVDRFAPDRMLIQQGGRRVRVKVTDVKTVTTVTDHLREFLRRRREGPASVAHEWILVEWARSKGLDAMARLQAFQLVLMVDSHEAAHEFLGHRKHGKQWSWPRGDDFLERGDWESHFSRWGHPLKLSSEHFRLRTDAGLRHAINLLFDLETLYIWFFDEFGKDLRLREILDPMDIHVRATREKFSAWTSHKIPYYVPAPLEDISHTYLEKDERRPEQLFALGGQQLLYNALADGLGRNTLDTRDRSCPWIELGLGSWLETLFVGEAGHAKAGEPRLHEESALRVLGSRAYGLENMLHLRYAMFHDISKHTFLHWANTYTFTSFLMSDDLRRKRTLLYLVEALRNGKGTSSRNFDKVFGTKVEKMEEPWISWLESQTGVKATRTR